MAVTFQFVYLHLSSSRRSVISAGDDEFILVGVAFCVMQTTAILRSFAERNKSLVETGRANALLSSRGVRSSHQTPHAMAFVTSGLGLVVGATNHHRLNFPRVQLI